MAKKVAKHVFSYLVNDKACHFPNDYDGNMKLQKILVFANLINLVNTKEPLFTDDMYAFKNGMVVESVRKPFHEKYDEYINSVMNEQCSYTKEEQNSINLSVDLFYHLSASELSDLHHEFQTWKNVYNRSRIGSYHNKPAALIQKRDLVEQDLEKLKSVLSSYERKEDNLKKEVVNGITFFYNSEEIGIDEHVLDYLEDVSKSETGDDSSFYLSMDEDLGVYYY